MMVVVGVAVVAAVISVLLRQYKPEYAMVISLAGGILLLGYCLLHSISVINDLHNLLIKTGIDSNYSTAILKAIGVCFITQLAGDTCRDAGENSLASKTEMGGRVAVLLIALPLLNDIAQLAIGLLN